ncbi:MAG TPA: TIGR02206 family membrane protein [Saprospiraceae bacterium]|nr:TIGR02206 family membrane protein [Saprospiraceae bacterium]
MWKSIIYDNGQFENYSSEHFIALIICAVVTFLLFFKVRTQWNEEKARWVIVVLLSTGMCLQLLKPVIRTYMGTFDPTDDFPFHLCNVMAVFMPFIMYFKWRTFWGIAFFWVIAGTFQALFTPTLTESFPHYEYFRYWLVHASLPVAAVFAILIYKWSITWRDMVHSMIALNVFALLVTPINLMLNGNYLYLRSKPPGDTLYNFLGPWPYYILSLEVVMFLLFGLLLLIFNPDILMTYFRKGKRA